MEVIEHVEVNLRDLLALLPLAGGHVPDLRGGHDKVGPHELRVHEPLARQKLDLLAQRVETLTKFTGALAGDRGFGLNVDDEARLRLRQRVERSRARCRRVGEGGRKEWEPERAGTRGARRTRRKSEVRSQQGRRPGRSGRSCRGR